MWNRLLRLSRPRPGVPETQRDPRASGGDADEAANILVDTDEGTYHVGEKWHYRTRQGEEDSLFTVLKVESSPQTGVIVHVSIDGLHLKSSTAPTGELDSISHLPFAQTAIDESVTTRAASGVPVTIPEGYEEWRRAGGGVFTIAVADAVELAQAAVT